MSDLPTPKSDVFLQDCWPRCVAAVTERLDMGKRVYGDSSFDRPLLQLIREVRAEVEDQIGWSAIAWAKLIALESAVEQMQARVIAECMVKPDQEGKQ